MEDWKKLRNRDYNRAYRERHRHIVKKRALDWYHANKNLDAIAEKMRKRRSKMTPEERLEYNAKLRETRSQEPYKRQAERSRYLCNYGITPEDKDRIFEQQGNKCLCCATTEPGTIRGWSLDHNHESKLIRGVICSDCNTRIGRMGDTPESTVNYFIQIMKYLLITEQLPNNLDKLLEYVKELLCVAKLD